MPVMEMILKRKEKKKKKIKKKKNLNQILTTIDLAASEFNSFLSKKFTTSVSVIYISVKLG